MQTAALEVNGGEGGTLFQKGQLNDLSLFRVSSDPTPEAYIQGFRKGVGVPGCLVLKRFTMAPL